MNRLRTITTFYVRFRLTPRGIRNMWLELRDIWRASQTSEGWESRCNTEQGYREAGQRYDAWRALDALSAGNRERVLADYALPQSQQEPEAQ
jgi:hypothetical protein